MSRPVYVLGAGFSHNFNPDVFPLVSDFLKAAKASSLYEPEHRHKQLAYVIGKYFNDPLYPDIEKILSFLSTTPLYNRQIAAEQRSVIYDELVEIIVGLLSEASKESAADSESMKETYQRFAAHLIESESTVITFNYDLLIETFLTQTGKWQRAYGYGAHIPMALKAMPTSPHTVLHQRLSEDEDMKWSPVTVLKLHGSINWGVPIIANERSEAVYQIPTSGGVSMADFVVQTEHGSPFTLYFKPVIVPPVLDKSFWLRNPTFRVLWNMAMEALESAEEITFVGYSLRATDFMAEFLLRQAVNMRSAERRFIIVDPRASKLKNRYLDVFGSIASIVDFSFRDCDFVRYANESLFRT